MSFPAPAISIPKTSARSLVAMVFFPRGFPACGRSAGNGFLDQFQMIDLAQQEEQFRLLIETRSDAVHDGGDMLAHAGPVRAGARHLDLGRLREQTLRRAG